MYSRQKKINNCYQGNCALKKSGVILEYTPSQIKEIKKCKFDIFYFLSRYVKVIHLDKGKIPFELYPYQKEMINSIHENLRSITLAPRQSGKTVGTCGYLLHYIIFNKYKNIAILANKEKTARKILAQIRQMYACLPFWLQQGIAEWNKGSIELENGSKIAASSTSGTAARGDSINLLYVDECAFVPRNIWDEFFSSAYPTVSSSKTAKIIFSSTPWGMNHFHKLWTDAESGKNEFKSVRVYWQDVPERDEKWKNKTISDIGIERFNVEFGCEFKGSAGTLLSGYTLQNLITKTPIENRYDEKFKIYEMPKSNKQYIVMVDVAEGLGQDSSTCQVIDVTDRPYKQVASYCDDTIKTNIFPTIIFKIGEFYNNALVIVENNGIGDGVLNDLHYELEYENIFFDGHKFGLRMTKGSKNNGNSFLKQVMEENDLIVNDEDTIDQFSKYIKKGNTYKAEDKEHDDLITPLVLFSFFINNKLFVEKWLDQDISSSKKIKDKINKIEEELLPIGFMCDGDTELDMNHNNKN